MRKILLIALVITGSLTLRAQDAVSFKFSDGIENSYLKTTMERQISNLLTAINRAESYNISINYAGVNIDDPAKESINKMWGNVHMRTQSSYIREKCLLVKTSRGTLVGYEVRNIAVIMVPVSDGYEGDLDQEICIDFDKSGMITDFNITLEINQVNKIMANSAKLNDLDKKLQIVHWMEQFSNAYCQKDIRFIDDVLSDDALIITGKKTVERVPYEGPRPTVKYRVMDKPTYLKNLRRVFALNSYVNVRFDNIEVLVHRRNPNMYGVKLVQYWNSSTYNDVGWLYVIWDFSDEFKPKILVRTWLDLDEFTLDEYLDSTPDLDEIH